MLGCSMVVGDFNCQVAGVCHRAPRLLGVVLHHTEVWQRWRRMWQRWFAQIQKVMQGWSYGS